jgi:hypothetical protein
MLTGSITEGISVGGISIQSVLRRQADSQIGQEITLPAGKAGALSTRSDTNTGTLTLAADHGITTGQKIDLYWDGGSRYNVTVGTVSGVSVPIDLGSGDDLPAQSTEVIACVRVEVELTFDSAAAAIVAAKSTQRGRIDFNESGPSSLYTTELTAGEAWQWAADTSIVDQIGGVVESILASNGTITEATLQIGVLYDGTP